MFFYFTQLLCALELVLSLNVNYKQFTSNTCPCVVESLSLLQCADICFQSTYCKGVNYNRDSKNCCVCSAVGIPGQTLDPEKFMYRTPNASLCDRDIVNDVADSQLTASSAYVHEPHPADYGPTRSRLNTGGNEYFVIGSWVPMTAYNEFIQVRFLKIREIFGVATQGRNAFEVLQCVSSYKVSYSVDCVTYAYVIGPDNQPKIFTGNYDSDTIVKNYLPESILAVCVRVHPVTYIYSPAMRFGLLGCD